MKPRILFLVMSLVAVGAVQADVVLLEKDAVRSGHQLKLGDKLHRDALAKQAPRPLATGSQTLTDSSGLRYFFNTDITFATSSSASGAASEASYISAVNATTLSGGTTTSTLNDAFDGYNALCVSLTGATGPCSTGNAAYTMYNQNGPATLDASCANRQVLLPSQTIGGLSVSRRMYVPSNDTFARWLNVFTNTTGAAISFNMITSNNLGSDSNTRVVSSSDGDAVAEVGDLWVSSFQNFSGSTSSDPRIGHVLQGVGAGTPVSGINFVDGDDNPYWSYALNLAPGETAIIANFATGQPSRAAAASKATELATLPANATQCMTPLQVSQLANFTAGAVAGPAIPVPAGGRDGWIALTALFSLLAMLAFRARNA